MFSIMNLTKLSKQIISAAMFVIVTIILYLLYEQGAIPFLIFLIGFGLTLLIIIFVWMASETWYEIPVIPIKRKR